MRFFKFISITLINLFIFTSFIPPLALAQPQLENGSEGETAQRSITGVIYSERIGNPAPNAKVILINSQTGKRTSQTTNSQGEFSFTQLPGKYSVWGTIIGYQSNVCYISLSRNSIKITFVLGRLGVANSSCAHEEIPSPTPTPRPQTSPVTDKTNIPNPDPEAGKENSTSPDQSSTPQSGSSIAIDCAVTSVGKPATSPTLPPDCVAASRGEGGNLPSGPCQTPPNYPADLITAIKQKWNITISTAVPSHQIKWVWEEFWGVDCTGILQDISGTYIGGTEVQGGISMQIGCPSTPGSNDVIFSIYGEAATKGLIMHELTHVWQVCTARGEQNVLEIPAAYNAEGGISKYSRNQCSLSVGDNWRNEDHADTIALYLNPSIGELTCGNGDPNPFSVRPYPRHRDVARNGTGK